MQRVRIVTWNLGGPWAGAADRTLAMREPRRLGAVCRTLDALRGEIVALQEVESARGLAEINAALAKPYEHVELVPGNSRLGLHQAFLSRFPFRCTSHRELQLTCDRGEALHDFADPDAAEFGARGPLRFQRDVLRADVCVPLAGTLTVFNLHLKSQLADAWRALDGATIRAAEARAAARLVAEHASNGGAGRPVVVVGDFNGQPHDASLAPLLDELGYDDVLQREWIDLSHAPVYTYNRKPHHVRIDYILLSPAARRPYRRDSARIHRDADSKRASDHFAVSVDLLFERSGRARP